MNDSFPPLPEYDPRADLWARIEADLAQHQPNAEEVVGQSRLDLPNFEPKQELWAAIQEELDTTPVHPIWSKIQHYWVGASLTAAAVIVLVGSWLMLPPKATERVRVEYTIEQRVDPLPQNLQAISPTVAKQTEEFIARQCADQRLACQRPEVHQLRNQLVKLNTRQQKIARERLVFGDDPAMIRAQVKLDNQRAEVLKELLTILRS